LRAGADGLTERIVLEGRDGGTIEAELGDATREAILRLTRDSPLGPG
jgi:hypothetical protein